MRQMLKLRGVPLLVVLGVLVVVGAVAASAASAAPEIANEAGNEMIRKHFTGGEPEVVFEGHESGELIRCIGSSEVGEVVGRASVKMTVTYRACSSEQTHEACTNTGSVTGQIVANLVGRPVALNEKHTEFGFVFEPEVKNAAFVKCTSINIGVQEAEKGGMDRVVASFTGSGASHLLGLTCSAGQQRLRAYWEGGSSIPAYLEAHPLLGKWQEGCINSGEDHLTFEEGVKIGEGLSKPAKFLPAKGEGVFPVALTLSSGKIVLESKEVKIECAQDTGGGRFVSTKEAKLTLKMTECAMVAGGPSVKCGTVEGGRTGVIESKELTGVVNYVRPLKSTGGILETGLALAPASGEIIAEIYCTALEKVTVKGAMIGVLSPLNTETKTISLALKRSGYVQTPSEYEGEDSIVATTLTELINGAKSQPIGLEYTPAFALTGEEGLIQAI